MKNTMKKSLSAAAGITFAATMSAAPVASADTSPFGMQNMEGGYLQVAEGKCGEGKVVGSEGKCGEKKMGGEGKCGEGKCGEGKVSGSQGKNKMKGEGKCGEGKCGESKVPGSQGKHGENE